MSELDYSGLSDRGRKRENNEDFVLFRENLLLVADGVGGEYGGDIASRLACEMTAETFFSLLDRGCCPAVALARALEAANAGILRAAAGQGRPMATTICALFLRGSSACYTHLGDSRIYLFRGGRLRRLTRDHRPAPGPGGTPGGEVPENIITRALGMGDRPGICVRGIGIRRGDIFFAVTDGLTGPVEDGNIAAVLRRDSDIGAAARTLVGMANERGGPDNITIGLLRVRETGRRRLPAAVAAVALAALLAVTLSAVLGDGCGWRLERARQARARAETVLVRGEVEGFLRERWIPAWERFGDGGWYEVLGFYVSGGEARMRRVSDDSLLEKYRLPAAGGGTARIGIDDLALERRPEGWRVSFVQDYRSGNTRERSLVTLLLVREAGTWKVKDDLEERIE